MKPEQENRYRLNAIVEDIEGDPKHRFSHMNIRMQAHSFYDYTYDGAYLWKGVYNNLETLRRR